MHEDFTRLHAFQALRSVVLRQMEKNIQTRLDAGNGRPTDFELWLDAFKEEIEPQVWNAVKIMNKKGYETASSGFAGGYGERQQIDGFFSVDSATEERLKLMGISVIPYPDQYMYGEIIIFYPVKPNLVEITAIWNRIVRRQVIHQFEQARLMDRNPDDPSRPTNSGKTCYALTEDAIEVLRQFGTHNWDNAVAHFLEQHGALWEHYQRSRQALSLPLKLNASRQCLRSNGKMGKGVWKIEEKEGNRDSPNYLTTIRYSNPCRAASAL